MGSVTPRGRHFFAGPGPTNIPDSVLQATAHATLDFMAPEFLEVYDGCIAGLKRVLRTGQEVFLYTGSGHAAWEATLVNLFSPGDRLLMIETGYFSETWARMAEAHGLEVQLVAADWRRGVDYAAVADALRADRGHAIKALCAVHNETATGLTLNLPQLRRLLDEAGHPALFLADTISSLGSIEFRMDDWGVDAVVGGSQKGLMLPVGFSFTAASAKAMQAHERARLKRFYWDWTIMLARRHRAFVGTVPIGLFYGLREALRLIEEEGLEQVLARHARLAEAARRCVRHWAGNGDGVQLFCLSPERASNSVTTVLMPEGVDADAVRRRAAGFNVGLGGGLGRLGGQVFRVGHLGDLNEPMLLGALAAAEMAMRLERVPHARGGVEAAMDHLATTAA
jgi:alanine-glyoxylate transaminase/serine-glyoxylate transaminase/serine-pyruvate transaminase